ncbi:MAG: DUF424 domain-containing protein [Halobacteriaceae archaeon]
MILSERATDRGRLVAVCDDGLIGETFENGAVSLTVTEQFYGGEQVTREQVVASLADASVANLVGTEAVELAIEEGFVDEANVLDVDGTLHAQFLRL